jgi:hypothetical protein
MFELIGRLLSYFFRRSPQGAARPPASAPNQPLTNDEMPIPPGRPIERTVERQVVAGTRISFSVTEAAYAGPDGSLDRVRDVRGAIGGDGHVIESYETLGGRCVFCMLEAQEMVAAGLMDLMAAEQYSLFCASCRSECGVCRRSTCKRHALAFQPDDPASSPLLLCPTCLSEAKRTQFFAKITGVLISPFVREPEERHQ